MPDPPLNGAGDVTAVLASRVHCTAAFLFLAERPTEHAQLHRAEPHGTGLHSQPVCGGHWFSGATGLASSGRPRRRTGERDRLCPCAKTDGHRHPSVIVLYFPMVCLPGTLLLGVSDFVWPTVNGWWVLLGVGCFTQLGQLALTRAMQLMRRAA